MRKKSDIENIKEILDDLEKIVPVIDKIGSGFSDTETTALALLLFFKEEKVLNKLSHIRKILSVKLSSMLSKENYDEFVDKKIIYWKPPYNKTKEEILYMIKQMQ